MDHEVVCSYGSFLCNRQCKMGDNMTTNDKLMLISSQLLLLKAQVEKGILIAKEKQRQRKRKHAKRFTTSVNRMRKRTI
ncbi:hypothetical protein DPMN_187673 [Dreissena polymorpha]|uniref:Uncharacterized protein n=1 Tax=Dreissena polymorpha TaxID=45954 RepID=A0A9D4DPY0_DREPO|nr:hypothetical protein DPMN_187673 [Dreissena polymorpha]